MNRALNSACHADTVSRRRLRARTVGIFVALTIIAACDRQGADRNARTKTSGEALAATPKPVVQQAPAYTVRPLDAVGAVSGVVEIDGALPPDSVIQTPAADQPVCIPTMIRRGIEHRGQRAAGVVVWIDGI